MLINVIGLRSSITLYSTPNHLKMSITGFFREELGSNYKSGVIIFGQDKILIAAQTGYPAMR
jgi:hypothetical protein